MQVPYFIQILTSAVANVRLRPAKKCTTQMHYRTQISIIIRTQISHASFCFFRFDVGYTLQVIISFCEMLVCKRKMKKNCKIGMHANCGDDTRCLEHSDSFDKEHVKATSSESISLYH